MNRPPSWRQMDSWQSNESVSALVDTSTSLAIFYCPQHLIILSAFRIIPSVNWQDNLQFQIRHFLWYRVANTRPSTSLQLLPETFTLLHASWLASGVILDFFLLPTQLTLCLLPGGQRPFLPELSEICLFYPSCLRLIHAKKKVKRN